jgi:Flp pilus assembly protein TadG
MKKRLWRATPLFPNQQNGQSMVELAVALTVMLWLLAGLIDFGVGFYSWVVISDSAQEGATYGSISPNDVPGIQARVRESSTSPIDLSSTTVTVTTHYGTCAGDPIKVDVVYDYEITMPFVGMFIGDSIPLHASSTATIIATTTSCSGP